jgi:probable phosphoglycerate mutase
VSTDFGLLRHAETLWNRERRIQGHQDSPLSALGERQAADWGRLLQGGGWTRMLASDLGRARSSAEGINRQLQLPLHLDPRLREQDWGRWSGRRLAEIRRCHGVQLAAAGRGWDFHPPGGEPRRAVLARGREALLGAARLWPAERILVISHEGLLKCILYHLLETAASGGGVQRPRPGALHRLQSDGRALRLTEINALTLA